MKGMLGMKWEEVPAPFAAIVLLACRHILRVQGRV